MFMFDISTVLTAYKTLIGFRQNIDAAGWQLTDLITSDSGLYYNHAHPLLTFDNLISVSPRMDQLFAGAAINSGFTAWVQEQTDNSIINALRTWIDYKVGNYTANNLLSDARLFSNAGSISNVYDAANGFFHCIEVVPYRNKGVQGKIKKIGLQFASNVTAEIKLFSSESANEIQTYQAVYTAAGGVQWFDVDWLIEGGYSYYIGYQGEELIDDYINGAYHYDYQSRGSISFPTERYYSAKAVKVERVAGGTQFFDVKENAYTLADNYGINLELSFTCDYTDFLVENKLQFANYIRYQVAIDFIRLMIANPSTKINRNESNIGNLAAWAQNEITGNIDEKNDGSLIGRWAKSLMSIQFDRTGLDSLLFPHNLNMPKFKVLGGEKYLY